MEAEYETELAHQMKISNRNFSHRKVRNNKGTYREKEGRKLG